MTNERPPSLIKTMTAMIGRDIAGTLPLGLGFAVVVFDLENGEPIAHTYNAKREDTIKALRELVYSLEKAT